MVMASRIMAVILLIVALPLPAFAAQFTATLDRNNVVVGERFTLNLTLSGASHQAEPDTAPLRKDFSIVGRGTSSSITMINNQMSRSIIWEFTLTSKREGTLTIPSLTVQTSQGALSSQAIRLNVSATPNNARAKDNGLTVKAAISDKKVYKNQPFIYEMQMTSNKNLFNLNLNELEVEGAIVEADGDPRIFDSVQAGVAVKVIEARYIVTPLESGELILPPVILQGDIQSKNQRGGRQRFGIGGFGVFGAGNLEPFSLATETIKVQVRPANEQVRPWLPAKSLSLSENWDVSQAFTVGEPVTRTITMVAQGVLATQLPSINDAWQKNASISVYNDTPEMENTIKGLDIHSWRQETFTIVPQQAGRLTLPEIVISWWDVAQNKAVVARLPERVIQVQPASGAVSQAPVLPEPKVHEAMQTTPVDEQVTKPQATAPSYIIWLYITIAVLAAILIGVLFWIIALKRRLASGDIVKVTKTKDPKKMSVRQLIKELEALQDKGSVSDVQKTIQAYGHAAYGLSPYASLHMVFDSMLNGIKSDYIHQEVKQVVKALQAALYASDKEFDIKHISQQLLDVLQRINQHNTEPDDTSQLPRLNP